MRLKIGILLGIFLLIALIWFIRDDDNLNSEISKENAQQAKAFPVEVTKVSFERVEHYLEAIGSFLPEDEVTVSTEVDGIVEKRFVDVEETVK